MRFSVPVWAGGGLVALLVLLVGGCDLPTESPNVETNTQLSAPLIADKNFVFLGGPDSQQDPLIDTTGSTFDSLFTVGDTDQTIYLEQEVNNFDVGSLDGAIDEAASGVGIDTILAEPIVGQSDVRTQSVSASYEKTNGTFVSTGGTSSSTVPPSGTEDTVQVSFGAGRIVTPPTTDVVDASGSTVQSVTFTGETVNQITFELENGSTNPDDLTNGSGGAPAIRLENQNGIVDSKQFASPISPGNTQSLDLDIAGATIGEEATLILTISGVASTDVTLTTDTQPELRYQAVTLGNPQEVEVKASATGVSAQGQTASRFAGVEVGQGGLELTIENNLDFPISIDTLQVENAPGALDPLPSDFPPLGVLTTSFPDIPAGAGETQSFDLGGSGVAQEVDATLKGHAAPTSGTITLRAADGIRTAGQSTVTLSTMHFWPQGERVTTSGIFAFNQDRIDFEQADDFVELASGQIRLQDLQSELGVTFESLTLSYPDLRLPDANGDGLRYAPGDSLEIRFAADHEGDPYTFPKLEGGAPPRTNEASIEGIRIRPADNQIEYHLSGRMETVPATTEQYLRTIQISDRVRSDVSIGQVDVRALQGRIDSYTVNVTPDANGDGKLDVGDNAEAQTASFDGFGGIASQLDGLELRGSEFTMSFETDVGADARFVSAIQGKGDDGRRFLKGQGSRAVASTDPASDAFLNEGVPVAAGDLIQFDVQGAPSNDPVTRSITLTETNSNVDAFISSLPNRVRLAGKTRIKQGRIRLRRPVTFDAGLNVRVPLSFTGDLTYRDTLDADLTELSEVTDPDKDVTISAAALQIAYANAIPIGFDVDVTIVDENGENAVPIPGQGESLRLRPAPKTDEGTAASAREGELSVDLTEEEVRTLAEGKKLRLQLTMDQQDQGPAVRVRADDTIQLSLSADIEGTVRIN